MVLLMVLPLKRWRNGRLTSSAYMATSYPEVGKDIIAKKAITDDNRAALTKALEAFRAGWQA